MRDHETISLLFGLITFLVGTLLGGVVNMLAGQYAVFKESKGVALAIRAELQSLVKLAALRNYAAVSDAIIKRLGDPSHTPEQSDVFSMHITQDYFSVFHALSPRLGLLGPLASNVVFTYAATKALVEDVRSLREQAVPCVEGRSTVTAEQVRALLLERTCSLNQLIKETMRIGVDTVNVLAAFAERRWLGTFK